MSIPTKGTLPDRLWTAFVPRPSVLRRPSDRVETLARWIALALVVVAVPVVLALGSAAAQGVRDEAARARAVSHPVHATITAVAPRDRTVAGAPPGAVDVTAVWTAADGSSHTVTGVPLRAARVGEPWSGWVDATGHEVRPSVSDSEADTDMVLVAVWAFLGPAAGLAGFLGLVRWFLDRRRMRDWDEDWALFVLGRNRGTTA